MAFLAREEEWKGEREWKGRTLRGGTRRLTAILK
jgi:hypothetical protein